MRWLRYVHDHTSIFTKVLVANAAVALVGSLGVVGIATYLWKGQPPDPLGKAALALAVLGISLAVNYVILRLAFQPLFTLQATLDRVRRGDFSARVPAVSGDPYLARVTETANLVLDRLGEHRQAVAAQILRAQEEERKRIARELHDETSQSLTSILVNLETVEQLLQQPPDEVAARVRLTKDIAQRTLDETRRLMFELRPSVLDDLGLVPALRWFISQRVHPVGLRVEFEATGLEERLSEDMETALFRILQEAISNTVKHAKARTISISVTREQGNIVGIVKDDGVGFHPVHVMARDHQGRGLGLFGMKERAALVGGGVQIDSAPGRGTTVRVLIPERRRGIDGGEDSRIAGR